MYPYFNILSDLQPLLPKLNIRETQNSFIYELELPGIPKESVNVSVKNNIVIIYGVRKYTNEQVTDTYHRTESSYGKIFKNYNFTKKCYFRITSSKI